MTKEMWPDPKVVEAHARGMHLLVIDGPGQGMSNIRNQKLTHGNYREQFSKSLIGSKQDLRSTKIK